MGIVRIYYQGGLMSSSSITDPGALRETIGSHTVPNSLVQPVKRFSFWAAIVLPFMHLSLLVVGLDSASMMVAFVSLVALNVFALMVGHTYGRE